MIRVCIIGLGKTGREIAKEMLVHPDIKIVSAAVSPHSEKSGRDLGDVLEIPKTGVVIGTSEHLFDMVQCTKPDVAIDFTNPSAAIANAKLLSKMGVNMVVGTTGFSKIGLKKLMLIAQKNNCGILYAPNITTGVNVMMLLTNLAASILNEYDFQVTEAHHKNKKDAPSGTAFKIATEIEKGLKKSGMDISADEIPINAVRAGGIVGKHEVMMAGEFDKIEISHESFSRKAFARGAVKAVRFIDGKAGYFEMSDVLNLKNILKNYVDAEANATRKKLLRYSVDMNKEIHTL